MAAHTRILEDLFLVGRLRPWQVNLGGRQVKTPKVHLTDTGLLTHLLNIDAPRLTRDATLAGAVFETFAVMELARQRDWAESTVSLFHYRDKQQREVDVVLELGSGEVAGVEVKAAATVHRQDFAGLRRLRERLGQRFRGGVVLYAGERSLPFGDRLAAAPLSALWS